MTSKIKATSRRNGRAVLPLTATHSALIGNLSISSTRNASFSWRAAWPLLVLPILTTIDPALSAPENTAKSPNSASAKSSAATISDVAPSNASTPNSSATNVSAPSETVANASANSANSTAQSVAPITIVPAPNSAPSAASGTVAPPISSTQSAMNATKLADFNVLLVPLDNIFVAQNSANTASANVASALTAGSDAARTVGPAEAAAAPLRRALLNRGLSDVLMAAPDGSVLRRALADGRISQDMLTQLRAAVKNATSMFEIATPDNSSATPIENASANSATATPANDAAISPIPALTSTVMRSAQIAADNSSANPIENAARQASRLGQALNYRVVLALALAPSNGDGKTRYVMLLTDTLRETGELFSFETDASSTGSLTSAPSGRRAIYEAGATVGSALLQQKLTVWAQAPGADRAKLADDALATARFALAQGQNDAAREALGRVLALSPNQRDATLLMGDVQLKVGDTESAILSYRRALSGGNDSAAKANNGAVWTQISGAYVVARNWPETLNAGAQALATGVDSSPLRVAMATAQIGRAQLFTDAGRTESADDALTEANTHLLRAQQMSPNDPTVLRLMAQQMTLQNRSREAMQMLDRAAPQMIFDRDFQVSYATLLVDRSGREADAFAAWMRATQLLAAEPSAVSSTRTSLPNIDRARYRRLIEGYDQTAAKMVTRAYNLTTGVVNGNISRDAAMLQIKPMTTDIATANAILKTLTPPSDSLRDAYNSRIEIGDTISQALNAYEMYAETGDDSLRDNAVEWHKDALNRLNTLRAG